MTEYCWYCGTEVREIDGKKFCPNCGIIESSTEDVDKDKLTYIG